MFGCLRFLALAVSGFLTVVFGIMALISSFRYTRYGSPTKKTIRVSAMYLAIAWISGVLTLIILDPAKMSAALVVLAIGLFSVASYLGGSYFNLVLREKGPRRMFAPVWQFLKRLFTPRNPG